MEFFLHPKFRLEIFWYKIAVLEGGQKRLARVGDLTQHEFFEREDFAEYVLEVAILYDTIRWVCPQRKQKQFQKIQARLAIQGVSWEICNHSLEWHGSPQELAAFYPKLSTLFADRVHWRFRVHWTPETPRGANWRRLGICTDSPGAFDFECRGARIRSLFKIRDMLELDCVQHLLRVLRRQISVRGSLLSCALRAVARQCPDKKTARRLPLPQDLRAAVWVRRETMKTINAS